MRSRAARRASGGSRPGARGAVAEWGRRYGPAVLLSCLLIAAWEAAVILLEVPAFLLPAPSGIADSLAKDYGILRAASLVTLQEIVGGFVLALAAGVLTGILLHFSPTARQTVYPLLIVSQTIPVVVLAPVLIVLLGYGILPKLAIVALICFFPVAVSTLGGLASVDPGYVQMMRTLHGSRLSIFRRVEFPSALPSIFTGMRIAATYAPIGAVFGEWSGSNQGLGFVMLAATPNLLTARIFAAIVLLSAMAMALFLLVILVEKATIPWASRKRPL